MAEKEKYIIKIEGEAVEVSPEVYYTYFRMERQERGQEEKKQRNDVVSYDALDNSETVGVEAVPDLMLLSMEETVMTREIYGKLHRAVDALPKAERNLIQAIYFDGLTEKEYAESSGLTQQGVSYRLRKTLSKLKSFMNFIGSF
jgi:RNA polymerase sigma factor (sigma-70 family)